MPLRRKTWLPRPNRPSQNGADENADQSDICTLRGFLYMVRIVQDPDQNGQRFYIDVMQNFEKALKLNPDNQLAKQLQQKFFEGMKQQTNSTKWDLFTKIFTSAQ